VGDVERIESRSLLRPGTNVTFVRLFYSNTIAIVGSEATHLNKKSTLFFMFLAMGESKMLLT